jgi:tetratricopeptide (TPR) repeat protein
LQGSFEEATECYKETLRVEKLVLGESHQDVSMTMYKLGEAYKALGALDNALDSFTEALRIERNTIGKEDPPSVARTLNEIGNIHLARDDVIPMMDAFNEAARIFRGAGLSPHSVVVSGQLYAFDVSCPSAAPAA